MSRFALTGIAGYVANRHLKAIKDTNNTLVAALDPHDSVGLLDSWFPEAEYFRDHERFDRFLDKCSRSGEEQKIKYLSVCSPNYLHDAHIRLAFHNGADAICEKPLVLKPENLIELEELEDQTGCRVWSILQLRVHPSLIKLKAEIDRSVASNTKHVVELNYITPRGRWYHYSWKGNDEKSGGITYNIGIHFFDLLHWLFGARECLKLEVFNEKTCAGSLELERAKVKWLLSIDSEMLPAYKNKTNSRKPHRSIRIDGEEIEFSDGFTDLHTRVYNQTLSGNGFGIQEARAAIETANEIRTLAAN